MSSSKLSEETPVPVAKTVAFSHFSKRQVRSGNSGCLHNNRLVLWPVLQDNLVELIINIS